MSVSVVDGVKVVDVRSLPPGQRHDVIFMVFDEIKPGEHILVVNDHEPVHLVHYLRHERRDFDGDAYTAHERTPGVWVAVIKRRMSLSLSRLSGLFEQVLVKKEVSQPKSFHQYQCTLVSLTGLS